MKHTEPLDARCLQFGVFFFELESSESSEVAAAGGQTVTNIIQHLTNTINGH